MTDKHLRIQSVNLQVVLVWDDGEELTPGPEVAPLSLPLSKAREALEALPEEVSKLEKMQLEDDNG